MNAIRFPILLSAAALFARAADRRAVPGALFSAYHEGVDRALDGMLRNLEQPHPEISPRRAEPAAHAMADTAGSVEASQSLEEAIEGFAAQFWNGRADRLRAALWRMNRMRPAIERILVEEGVPARFAAMVLVESGASPVALSPKSVRRFWQLIPGTARRWPGGGGQRSP